MTNLEKLNARLNRPDVDTDTQEVHAPDGSVSRGADAADAVVNMQLGRVLRRRAMRGRDPMAAHILGFFEGEAAEVRAEVAKYGQALHRSDADVSLNGVDMSQSDAVRELEGIT